MTKPVVALVGRPNVGKSTLFNRLAGEQLAIVDNKPGTTRDRLFAEAEWNGIEFSVVDTGGIDPSTGGKEPLSLDSADYIRQIRGQAEMAMRDADAILFLVDAAAGVTPADQEVANILRRNRQERDGKPFPPVFLVANKADSQTTRLEASEFYELGMGDPYPISAVHGTNTGDLLDDLVASFPPQQAAEEDESIKIAIVGKPNVGKSSLLNRLVGEERAIVSPIPGTTRDAVDTSIEFNDLPITLIDTAGMRRRGKVEVGVEKYSVIRTMRAIDRADVALLVIDATAGISAQDAHIAGYILEAWKSCVVLVNKWDAIEKDSETMNMITEVIRKDLNFMAYVPILFISAKTGQRVDEVLPLALKVQEERLARLTTSQLNAILQSAQDEHKISSKTGKEFKIYYATQVRSDPPTFLVYCNDPKIAHFSYVRYLENRIRSEYQFTGTPIHLVFKARHQ
ncbi:MAG TPA: ribosome biogenesis GTPase Der [Anaerolineaceae bacterium]|nr:ribosome biogenesis GTPase Der [Anaerolineaceae bacterium]